MSTSPESDIRFPMPISFIDRGRCAAISSRALHMSLPEYIPQEVDNSFLSTLNARLGVGGRYRFYPQRVPSESTYFTMVFVRVSTVTVHDSSRTVRQSENKIHWAYSFRFVDSIIFSLASRQDS